MLSLDLNLTDYIVDDEDRKLQPFVTNTAVSMTILRTAMQATKGGPTRERPNGEGHKSKDSIRAAGRAIDALTLLKNAHAKDPNVTTLKLDLDVLIHLKETLDQWTKDQGIPGTWAGWFGVLYKFVEKKIEEGEAAAKAEKTAKT